MINDYIIVCDQVIVDENTKKHSIIGMFNKIDVDFFPVTLPPFYVYMKLSEIDGFDHVLTISDGETELYGCNIWGQFTELVGLSGFSITTKVLPLTLESESILKIRFKSGDRVMCETSLVVDYPPVPRFKEFSIEDIDRIIKSNNLIKSAAVEVKCRRCGNVVKYGISIDPNHRFGEEVITFPKSLIHQCEKCGSREWLGRYKTHILDIIGKNPKDIRQV